MAVGAVVARILTQYSDKGSKQAQKDIYKLGKNIDAYAKKATKAFGLVAAASVALSVKIGSDAVKAAIEDSKSQLILSNALRATTGATTEAIAVVEDYISKQQRLTNVQDTELRASLQSLVVATGDVSEAQRLQSIALDISAATGKDLNTVTIAMVRAQQGNTTALKRLSPELSGLITKTTKAEDIFSLLGATYEGSAKKLAEQDPLTSLKIEFGELAEQVGFALLPAVIQFTDYMITDLIPTFEEFVRLNDEKITKNILGLADAIETLVRNGAGIAGFLIQYRTAVTYILGTLATLVSLARTILLLTTALGILKTFKSIKLAISLGRGSAGVLKQMFSLTRALTFIMEKARLIAGAIGLITAAFRAQGIAAGFAAIATALATGGVSLITAATALAAIGVTALATKNAMDALTGSQNKNTKAATDAAKNTADEAKRLYDLAAAETAAAAIAAAAKKRAAAQAAADKARAAAALKAKKDAAAAALLAKVQAGLAKFGVKTTETDPIQLEAARLNLIKQGNLAEAARIAMMGKNLELQLEANKALARYNDLLAALADKEISSEEVFLLSKKWGMTIEATQSYIQTLLAVADQTISDDEITNLAKAWGVSKEKAGMYLDFFTYLNDGKLSDAEIAKLQSKWGLTSKEVGIYADLITKASDYVLSDKEIEDLKKNWGLTTDEVVAYIRKLGQPVTFSGTLIDPATQATLGWKNALAALQAYLAALAGKGIAGVVPAPVVPGGKPIVPSPIVPGYGSSKDEKEEAAATTSGGNLIKALEEIASATSTSSINAAVAAATEIGVSASEIANSMVAGLLEQGVSTQNALSSARYTGQAIAAQQQAEEEAAERALRNQQYAEGMAKRYGGFVGSSTIDNAKGLTGSSSGTASNITINVAGSVTTENDLVQTVRSGLLRGQYNGQSLTLEAI